ncbi:UBP-type zinc finger domain-containing protein [Candidatus Bathyarchaeota archaeon]|nr:UBP-type zinc finger domain-containing protein [Candidatus Bathyarchaeota archaeon]
MASYTFKPFPPPTPNLIELPTCPVCLERMDDTNGLMTIPCQHVFHCRCLQSWKGSGCPVCRFTGTAHNDSGGSDKDPFGSAVSNLCAVCDTTDDLWICLVCGRVGCGRYKGGHAKEHWKETSHCFALEIETQHVWDYAGDAWVHRLIRAKGDGQVVEVPSHNSGGPSREEEDLVPSSKVEGMALEYTRMFTSQMESQRVYFEEMVAQAADKAHKASNAAEKAAARADAAEGTLRTVQDKYEQLEEQVALLERDLAREGARATKATELARKLGKEFQDEKQMSKGLADRVTFLKESLKGMEELQRELEEMRELNQDLTANLSFKDSLSQMKDEGLVEQEEIEGATATAGPSKRKKKKK